MERATSIIEEIYRILGTDFKPKIIDEPLNIIEVKSFSITLDTKILDCKIEGISGKISEEKVLSSKRERFSSKVLSIPVDIKVKLDSDLEIVNNVFIKKYPTPWKDLSDEIKVKLLYEIKTRWESYSEGLKIIGVYKDIPVGRIKTLMVDENTGILSFNLKDTPNEGERNNLLVFKFLQDDKLRSIVF